MQDRKNSYNDESLYLTEEHDLTAYLKKERSAQKKTYIKLYFTAVPV